MPELEVTKSVQTTLHYNNQNLYNIIGGIANLVPELSLKAQFRFRIMKMIVLVLKLSHLAQFRL
jgi:hypothetical protein